SIYPDHIRIGETPYTYGNTGNTMTIGHPYRVGSFQLACSSYWVGNSHPNFTLQDASAANKTVCAAVVWVGTAAAPTGISSSGSGTGQRTVSVSSTLTLNPCNVSGSATSTNVSCFGGSNGTATASPSGGISPYRYLWSNG